MGATQKLWFIMENPIRMDDLRVPPHCFKETSISLYYNIIAIIDHYSLVSFHSTIMMLRTTICHNHCIILRTPVILGMNVDCGYHNHMRVTSVLVQ